MNLSGIIGILQTSHPQNVADKNPVETSRQDSPRDSFEQLVSKAVDETPKNERKAEAAAPSQKPDQEDRKAATAATVSDSKKENEPKTEAANQQKAAEHAVVLKDQPKDKNTSKLSAKDSAHTEKAKDDKKSEKESIKTDIAELLTQLDALKHILQKGEPSKTDLSKIREKISTLTEKISREIAQSEQKSTPDHSLMDLLKKQNSFLKKIDALLADASSPRDMRRARIDDLSQSLTQDLREIVKLAEKKNTKGVDVRIEQPAVKNTNEENQKETSRTSTASTDTTQNMLTAPSKESGDSSSQSSLFKQFSFAQDSTGIVKQTAPQSFLPFADKLDEIISQAKITTRDGKNGQISMKMFPESLGSVNVNLGLENGVLTAKFLVENTEAKDALTANLAMLKDTLSNEGIAVGSFQVDVRGDGRFLAEEREPNEPVHYMPHEAKEAELEYNLRQSSTHNGRIDLVI